MCRQTNSLALSRRLLIILGVIVLAGCASRYRLNLTLTAEGTSRKVKVENVEYLVGTKLDNPYSRDKTAAGAANVIIITTGARWPESEGPTDVILRFDEYLRNRLFIQLPVQPEPDTLSLAGNSFVQLLGRYDLSPAAKMFLPTSGTFIIDSVDSRNLFGTIDGSYKSEPGMVYGFSGRIKVKVAE
ncbi:MAG TPA: hypothetical protein VN285_08880 [Candidatus Deferrimicrobium sp.]|nr:hypothetical protein [Candidatus Deferrimicrobium sp.]